MGNTALVRSEQITGVAVLTVTDPTRRNAVTAEMSAALVTALQRAESDPAVRAVVVTGEGTAFCAGADLAALEAASEDGLRRIYAGFMALGRCPLPTIAAVNGPAVGAGLNLALAADVRIAGPTAVFDARFLRLGVHPGGGATWLLQRAIGPQAARAALLFGSRFDATDAVRTGLAYAVADDPVAAAIELAGAATAVPRELVLATKATMDSTRDIGSVEPDHHRRAMELELAPQLESLGSEFFAAQLSRTRGRRASSAS